MFLQRACRPQHPVGDFVADRHDERWCALALQGFNYVPDVILHGLAQGFEVLTRPCAGCELFRRIGPVVREVEAEEHLQIRLLRPLRHLQHARVVAEASWRVHPDAEADEISAGSSHDELRRLALGGVEIVVLHAALLALQNRGEVVSQQHTARGCCHGAALVATAVAACCDCLATDCLNLKNSCRGEITRVEVQYNWNTLPARRSAIVTVKTDRRIKRLRQIHDKQTKEKLQLVPKSQSSCNVEHSPNVNLQYRKQRIFGV